MLPDAAGAASGGLWLLAGGALAKAFDWLSGRKRAGAEAGKASAEAEKAAAEADEIVSRVYKQLIGELERRHQALRKEFTALDDACKAKMRALESEIAELRGRNHALATVARALVNKKPVPDNHKALLDELARADPYDAD